MFDGHLDLARQLEAEWLAKQRPLPRVGTRKGPPDFLSAAGAATLARRIRKYWEAAGFEIEVEVYPVALVRGEPVMGIRSNLRNGLPAKSLGK